MQDMPTSPDANCARQSRAHEPGSRWWLEHGRFAGEWRNHVPPSLAHIAPRGLLDDRLSICLLVATRQLLFGAPSKRISISEHLSTSYRTHLFAIWPPNKAALRRRHHANRSPHPFRNTDRTRHINHYRPTSPHHTLGISPSHRYTISSGLRSGKEHSLTRPSHQRPLTRLSPPRL